MFVKGLKKDQINCAYFIFVLIVIILTFPFIIADLAFAYDSSIDCLNKSLSSVSFTLKAWLEIDGYFRLMFLLVWIFLVILACWEC